MTNLFVANLGVFAAGCNKGWSSPVRRYLVNTSDSASDFQPAYDFVIRPEDFVWIASLVSLGAAVSCPLFGSICKLAGRKLTMLLLVIPFTIGWALITFPTNVTMLIVGRFLLGMVMGAFCVAVPMYTGEIAEPKIRGTLGTYFEIFFVCGSEIPYVIGAFTSVFTLNLICASIPIVFAIVFVFMPESPLYLISKGQKEAAIKSWKWLRGDSYDYRTELKEWQEQHESEKKKKSSLIDILKRRSTIKSILISWGLTLLQQTTGVHAVVFYAHFIFDQTGSSINSSLASIIIGGIQIVTTILSSLIVDKLGRRLLLIPSCFMMCAMTFVLGAYFYMKDQNSQLIENLHWIPITSLCIYMFFYAIGIGNLCFDSHFHWNYIFCNTLSYQHYFLQDRLLG